DWSSDVCSSDLGGLHIGRDHTQPFARGILDEHVRATRTILVDDHLHPAHGPELDWSDNADVAYHRPRVARLDGSGAHELQQSGRRQPRLTVHMVVVERVQYPVIRADLEHGTSERRRAHAGSGEARTNAGA